MLQLRSMIDSLSSFWRRGHSVERAGYVIGHSGSISGRDRVSEHTLKSFVQQFS
jgi:hypothetical protein